MLPRAALAAAAAAVWAAAPASALTPYPLQGIVDATRGYAANTTLLAPTGLGGQDYLKLIHGVVTWFLPYQSSNGSIIDPYANQEIQYATPCFAFAAALMVDTGFDATLLGPASLALDSALEQLASGKCASGHNNFFTYPSYSAYTLLKAHAPAARVAQWEANLAAIDPKYYVNLGGNWGLVAAGGEFARVVLGGFGRVGNSSTWWADQLTHQIDAENLTPTGNYQDHSGTAGLNPLPYDTFPLKYLSVMLQEGVSGERSVARGVLGDVG